MSNDPRIDAYIAKSAEFARPILTHLRAVIHQACPHVQETMKWSFPHFEHHGVLCSMASFKQHCAFGFWKGALVLGEDNQGEEAMGHFGRITSIKDLPAKKVLVSYIKRAMTLNEEGVKAPKVKKEKAPLVVPDYFLAALKKNQKVQKAFESFSPSHQREYVE